MSYKIVTVRFCTCFARKDEPVFTNKTSVNVQKLDGVPSIQRICTAVSLSQRVRHLYIQYRYGSNVPVPAMVPVLHCMHTNLIFFIENEVLRPVMGAKLNFKTHSQFSFKFFACLASKFEKRDYMN
jgi:hypothetical protein